MSICRMLRCIAEAGMYSVSMLFLSLVAGCALAQKPVADLILYNGTVWTVDKRNPKAEAIAIRGDQFTAVGTNKEVLSQRGPGTRVIDLQGKFVLPGFNDSHVHLASAARFLEFNIMKTATQEEFVKRVREVVTTLPKGEWILGGYWGAYDQWALGSTGEQRREAFTPDMARVEAITENHPMFIQKFDSSEYAANSAALRAVELDPRNPRARGIEFVRDAHDRFAGIMRGEGVRPLFISRIPRQFSHERRIQQTKCALREIARHGVTSISDMSDDEQLEIYHGLRKAGELTVRVHFRYGLDRWKELADRGIKIGSGDEWIRLGSLKGHIDGIMGTNSARFLEPYSHNPTNRGRWRRLVHAQVIASANMQRLGELDVVAEVQPFHLSDDMRWMEERIGHERCKGAYAFKDIKKSGAVLSFGTDWPGTSASEYPINPMLPLYAAVTRQTITGRPPEGWFPKQRITIEEAIEAYTYNNAYASFEERVKGSIEVGKLADLVVLSQNLLQIDSKDLLKSEVLYTIAGGKIVYRKQ